jgi:glycosyltransferase involved in cell wall biosynthesis
MTSPRRVAFVFVSMPVGGAEDFALAVAPHLGPDFEPHFVCLREPGVLGEEARAAGWPVHIAPFYTSRRINPLNFGRFARWLRANDFSLVHSQNHHAHIFATRAAGTAGIPSVVHQQKTLEAMPWRRRMQLRGSLRRADRVLALSPGTATGLADFFGVPQGKLSVVPNAIDRGQFHPSADSMVLRTRLGLPVDRLLLGTAARLHPHKNHAAVIGALAALRLEGVNVSAVFLGEGALRGKLEEMANAVGVSDRVIFAGRQRPVAPWLQALDYFVLPSIWEGQPLALLQALACGLPVLASRIEGNTAVLGEDHPGLFAPNDPAELARLVASPPLRSHLLEHQASRPVPYGDEVASLLKAVYHSVLS